MAIQNRRGAYEDFIPSKMLPGEIAVVQSGDTTSSDGKSVYMAFQAGDVKRLATHDEVTTVNIQAAEAAENAQASQREVSRMLRETTQNAEDATQSAQDAEAALEAMRTLASTAMVDIADARDQAVSEAEVAIDEAKDEALEEAMTAINEKAQQIVNIKTSAEETAHEALDIASNTENHLAALDSDVASVRAALDNVSIDPDDLGLYQDMDTFYVYPTYKGVRSENGIPLAGTGGGGGGGGSETVNAVLTAENTSGWLAKTVASGSNVSVSIRWSSIEDGLPTGNGSVRITVNEVVRSTQQIEQGEVTLNITPYLTAGSNKVKVRISDTYDQGKTITYNITVITLSISSTFDTTTPFDGIITFPYTPVGAVEKTVHFIVDGRDIGTQTTSVSNRQLTFSVPAQTHGAHSLRAYFESVINNETVRSNELYYEFISLEPLNDTVIITSSFSATTQKQYASIPIPYQVYDPTSLEAQVTISVNGTVVSTQTVDRREQSYTIRANNPGTLTVAIACKGVTKIIQITVTESEVDVEAETENLKLYLTSQGRSNNEEHPEVWKDEDNNISATLTGFNFTSDGWQPDADGITCLRVSGDARVDIPYQPFATDFRATGKTIELEFATRNVLDYDATILSCMSGDRGLSVTAQKALLKSEQSEISTQYKEDEHVRVSFVCQKRAETKILYIYINGIISGGVPYPADDDFSQVNPVNISIGSSDCTIDIYNIRIYDNNLTSQQMVDNWTADTQDGSLMLERYTRNNVYDAYGNVTIANLPSDLPYFIIVAPELPTYKGNKKTCDGSFTNPLYPSKSYEFNGATIDIQGTSSQYYPRKNWKIKFNNGFDMQNGSHVDKYAMNANSIPVKTFCFKADVASSEGANNVELVRLYDEICPYKTPAQKANSKVRQGIDGFPMVIFYNDGLTTSFMGKYNYNNDKSTEDVFGFATPDESWETLNNTGLWALWKTADYSDPGWKTDFEARFPDTDPAYEDYTQLKSFADWIVTTDREAATNATLPSPVTYDEVEYTTDTADYRLAKFKAEVGNYVEIESAEFYWLFTELFLMVDSRAKNAFPSFIGEAVNA